MIGPIQLSTNQKAYCTRYSQAVTHPSTDRARRCLTSQIRRDGVCSTWYGRRHLLIIDVGFCRQAVRGWLCTGSGCLTAQWRLLSHDMKLNRRILVPMGQLCQACEEIGKSSILMCPHSMYIAHPPADRGSSRAYIQPDIC